MTRSPAAKLPPMNLPDAICLTAAALPALPDEPTRLDVRRLIEFLEQRGTFHVDNSRTDLLLELSKDGLVLHGGM